ncbi:MAG: H-NS histone family protein [Bradyrhizobium sp.]
MKKNDKNDLESMSVDQLWVLHEKVAAKLAIKLLEEKATLEKRLMQLNPPLQARELAVKRDRRSYPVVLPKFRNPEHPAETWAGRGKQPKWLTRQLKSGKRMDDFRIAV